MHRAVWPEATVGQHSSPSREETQTHEGQVETVSHVEEPLVQTGAEAGITWGNRRGGSGAEHPPLGPASGSGVPVGCSFLSTRVGSSLFPHLLPARHPEWLHFGRSHVKSNQPETETLIREWLTSPRNTAEPPCAQPQERPHLVLALT